MPINLAEQAIEFKDQHGTSGWLQFTGDSGLCEDRPLLLTPTSDAALVRDHTCFTNHLRKGPSDGIWAALAELTETARGTDDLMPPIKAAVKAYATLGEICGALRGVFGDYQPPTAV